MTMRIEMQPILKPEPSISEYLDRFQIDNNAVIFTRRCSDIRIELGEAIGQKLREFACSTSPANRGEQYDSVLFTVQHRSQALNCLVIPLEEIVKIGTATQHIVGASMERDDRRVEGKGSIDLIINYLIQEFSSDGQVGVVDLRIWLLG